MGNNNKNLEENKDVFKDLSKEFKINEEVLKFKDILKNVDDNKKKAINSLINNIAFMSVSLEELQSIINKKGYTESYKNGANQYGTKDCIEVKTYNSMFKNYSSAIKQLIDLLPQDEEEDELLKFIRREPHKKS